MCSPFINPNGCVSLHIIAVTSPQGNCDWSQLRPLDTWPCAPSPPSQSAAAAAASLPSYTLYSQLCWGSDRVSGWLTDWLTASSSSNGSRRRRKEERAAASRQPISGSGLANVQPRGSSTTVSATGRATSLKLGYYGDKEREHFAGSPPLSPPRSCSVPPHFIPLFLSLTTGHSVSQPPSSTAGNIPGSSLGCVMRSAPL